MKKAWHNKIREHINYWSKTLSSDKWRPKYVYHFTDIFNAISILKSECLYSRDEASRRKLLKVDGASSDVIDRTNPAHHRFVRMYYRPRTPTQYCSEGIRTASQIELHAHMPRPVFFLFDAYELMSREDAHYSDGNMATSYVRYGPEEEDFDAIPFKKVFHNSWFLPNEKGDIVFHRHAELLIPNELKLDAALKAIVCRSQAELQTLKYLLPNETLRKWKARIYCWGSSLFEMNWTFVTNVELASEKIIFHTNPTAEIDEPFNAEILLRFGSGRLIRHQREIIPRSRIEVPLKDDEDDVEIRLTLNDIVAYQNRIWIGEMPF